MMIVSGMGEYAKVLAWSPTRSVPFVMPFVFVDRISLNERHRFFFTLKKNQTQNLEIFYEGCLIKNSMTIKMTKITEESIKGSRSLSKIVLPSPAA